MLTHLHTVAYIWRYSFTHLCTWMRPSFLPLTAVYVPHFFPPSLDGKNEERRVNIDAHSVPSQPQSIWIHSSLWRTNNLEETLVSPSTPSPAQTSSLPAHLLSLCFSTASVSSHLVNFLLSSPPPHLVADSCKQKEASLAFYVCVPSHC